VGGAPLVDVARESLIIIVLVSSLNHRAGGAARSRLGSLIIIEMGICTRFGFWPRLLLMTKHCDRQRRKGKRSQHSVVNIWASWR
jgi:hypothetical protein